MPTHYITPSLLNRYAFVNRERQFVHTSYEDELAPYYYLVNGDKEKVLECAERFFGGGTGKVSEDPLRNVKYLSVSIATLACRFCIEAGLDPTVAYNASDMYIQRVDVCESIDKVGAVVKDMMLFYCEQMIEQNRSAVVMRPVTKTMNYIDAHLHEKITLQEAAEEAGVTRTYLSSIFSKETGMKFNDYILERKIEAAKNMLRFTDMTVSEIAAYLAFSNHSHFDRVFRKITGETSVSFRSKNISMHNS